MDSIKTTLPPPKKVVCSCPPFNHSVGHRPPLEEPHGTFTSSSLVGGELQFFLLWPEDGWHPLELLQRGRRQRHRTMLGTPVEVPCSADIMACWDMLVFLSFFCASERKKIPKKNAGIPGLHLLLALREAAQRVLARINAQ